MKAPLPILAHRDGGAPDRRNQPAGRVSPADEEPSRNRRAGGFDSIWTIRSVLFVQIGIFLVLVSMHFGLLLDGYRHRDAGATECLIAAVLVAGLLLTWSTRWSRRAATVAQSFATLGVLVGLVAIALGIGPRTILDFTLNGALLLTLIAGLTMMLRTP